jgi:FtsH-binding integral membrane protein
MSAGAGALSAERNKVLRNTYLLLALTMVPTFIGAVVGVQIAPLFFRHPIIASLVMLGAMIGFQLGIARNRNSGLGVGLLLGFTFFMGAFLGPVLAVALSMKNGPQLIGLAAVGTGGVMLAMSTIATTVKKDFSFMGKFLLVGMITLLVIGLANMFFQLPGLALALSALTIVVFSLFLLMDVSRIVNGGEDNYIMAATGVYASLWAIFSNLLNLLLAFGGSRD